MKRLERGILCSRYMDLKKNRWEKDRSSENVGMEENGGNKMG